jgi:hypothetical protein
MNPYCLHFLVMPSGLGLSDAGIRGTAILDQSFADENESYLILEDMVLRSTLIVEGF